MANTLSCNTPVWTAQKNVQDFQIPKKIHDAIDAVVVISLKEHTKRRIALYKNLNEVGISRDQFTHFIAIDGRNRLLSPPSEHDTVWKGGPYGCYLSHKYVFETAKKLGLKTLLVIEDDAELDHEFLKYLDVALKEVPEDWDMLYFGGQHLIGPTAYSDYLCRCRNVNRTHCYAAKVDHMLDDFFSLEVERRSNKDLTDIETAHIDHMLGRTHWLHNVYALNTFVVGQRGSTTSAISGKLREKSEFWNCSVESNEQIGPMSNLYSLSPELYKKHCNTLYRQEDIAYQAIFVKYWLEAHLPQMHLKKPKVLVSNDYSNEFTDTIKDILSDANMEVAFEFTDWCQEREDFATPNFLQNTHHKYLNQLPLHLMPSTSKGDYNLIFALLPFKDDYRQMKTVHMCKNLLKKGGLAIFQSLQPKALSLLQSYGSTKNPLFNMYTSYYGADDELLTEGVKTKNIGICASTPNELFYRCLRANPKIPSVNVENSSTFEALKLSGIPFCEG